jgi:hypothetical protein
MLSSSLRPHRHSPSSPVMPARNSIVSVESATMGCCVRWQRKFGGSQPLQCRSSNPGLNQSSERLHSGKFRLPPPGFHIAFIAHLNAPRGAQGSLVHTIVLPRKGHDRALRNNRLRPRTLTQRTLEAARRGNGPGGSRGRERQGILHLATGELLCGKGKLHHSSTVFRLVEISGKKS